MANIRLSLNQPTAELVANGAMAIFVPWKKQPPEGAYVYKLNHKPNFVYYDKKELPGGMQLIKPPCQQGDTLYLLETWGRGLTYNRFGILYKADCPDLWADIKWHSPVTMPNKACRNVWTVGKVEAVQAKGIVGHTANQLGFCKELASHQLLHDGGYKECKIAFRNWFIETYPHLSMNAWGWYIEKG